MSDESAKDEMDNEDLRRQIDQTRSDLSEKLTELEAQVAEAMRGEEHRQCPFPEQEIHLLAPREGRRGGEAKGRAFVLCDDVPPSQSASRRRLLFSPHPRAPLPASRVSHPRQNTC